MEEVEYKLPPPDDRYQCCCTNGMTDKRVLIYCTQVAFGLIVMLFCITQLYIDDRCDRTSIYLPLLTSIIGYFLPSPTMNKKK